VRNPVHAINPQFKYTPKPSGLFNLICPKHKSREREREHIGLVIAANVWAGKPIQGFDQNHDQFRTKYPTADEMLQLEETIGSQSAMPLREMHEFDSQFTQSRQNRQTRTDLSGGRAEHGNERLLHSAKTACKVSTSPAPIAASASPGKAWEIVPVRITHEVISSTTPWVFGASTNCASLASFIFRSARALREQSTQKTGNPS
jgi:hypothetical protein